MKTPILDIRNLSVEFPSESGLVQAVQNVSFSLLPGETVSVVGESGSGKSVTSLAAMGLLPKSARVSGEIWYQNPDGRQVDLLKLSPDDRRRYRGGKLSMIFQEPMSSLNPVLTCGDQVIEAILLHREMSREQAAQEALSLFQEVKLPTPKEMLDRYPHQLSGGQIQRVMIAMALSGNPAVLIADEPTTALDVTIQATILQLLKEIRDRRDMAILFITHDMGVVAEIADRVVVMFRGKAVETARAYELFSAPKHPYTKGLLSCRPRPDRTLKRLPTVSDFMQINTNSAGEQEIIAKPLEVQDDARWEEISSNERYQRFEELTHQQPLLAVRNLIKSFPVRTGLFGRKSEFRAVDDVSFDIFPGETLGLVGESGCGKSTLSRALLRLIEPTSGQIFFDGKEVLGLNASQLRHLRREMQIVFQNPYSSMDPRQTIGSALIEPMQIHNIGASNQERHRRAVGLLDRVGLPASAMNRRPHEFSGGQRQRISIARTLVLQPRFIICDESVSALDVSVQAQVLNLLKDLQHEFGLTYMFISHDLSVVKFVSDRIMVMNKGKIEEIGQSDVIYSNPTRDYTKQLIRAIPKTQLDDIRDRQVHRLSVVE
ncbi:ABC transporter ATP-binding protein [Microcoleus sp. FACHB-1515]|uniref:ABC transporter ATP-binding protein n=1 Tax=Cyanophyceae TaxID=3028117 RepID=UPI0016845105|nr:ABC transporter ATP-binding protein [Microcoleus sp. FACHB-1515]MBD2089138.1 ABC transporter ATP-binding protein [Microcoleus sp. FACHB-1515]